MVLNLPQYSFRIKDKLDKKLIFDGFRRRWVALTPEEWVRQNFVRFLTEEKHYPASLVAIERSLRMNQRDFRTDIVLFSKSGNPLIVVECKAPEVKISQQVFDQIARYNLDLRVSYLIVTNGLNHYCCRFDQSELTYTFLPEIPDYLELEN
ncbi:MAG TPA: type I restriction enzyme HsdR N-terminal domain-containing protein [Prolixibacteraceae bacterium]|nr:type I restriction enzyme HsdR N-terminal domain-containing protein [Prolixibacteraceae bacterium]